MGIDYKIEIRKSIEEVFYTVSNPANLPNYDKNIVEVKPSTQREIGVGMKYHLVTVQFGKRINVELEITALEPNHFYAFRVNGGPFPVETKYTFLSQGNTTIIIGKREPQPEGIWNVFTPILSIPARKKFERELNSLKIYLNSRTLSD